jgi:hypothetical protein|tara:strand:+ start:396 stop:575 length:180 start_codon:yes stop_codon:yes gene_type:complete
MKNLMIGFLITAAMILGLILSVESGKLSTAMNQIEAHKLAMVHANKAIHTFADPIFAKN